MPTERFCNIETSHSKGAGYGRINRESTDSGKASIETSSQYCLAITVEARVSAGVPFVRKPLEMTMPVAPRSALPLGNSSTTCSNRNELFAILDREFGPAAKHVVAGASKAGRLSPRVGPHTQCE